MVLGMLKQVHLHVFVGPYEQRRGWFVLSFFLLSAWQPPLV